MVQLHVSLITTFSHFIERNVRLELLVPNFVLIRVSIGRLSNPYLSLELIVFFFFFLFLVSKLGAYLFIIKGKICYAKRFKAWDRRCLKEIKGWRAIRYPTQPNQDCSYPK